MALRMADGDSILAAHEMGCDNVKNIKEWTPEEPIKVVLIHKDFISYVPISIERISHEYTLAYENDVFLVFLKKSQFSIEEMLADRLRGPNFFFVHIPKTAGTTIHNLFMRRMRSYVHLTNPELPAESRGEHRSYGGHLTFSQLENARFEFDLVFSIVRNPIERFLSMVKHSRRKTTEKLGWKMQLLRDNRLDNIFQKKELLKRIQSEINMITNHLCSDDEASLEERYASAIENLTRKRIIIWDIQDLDSMARFFSENSGIKLDFSERLNVTEHDMTVFSPSEQEFVAQEMPIFFEAELDRYAGYKKFIQLSES